MPSLTDLNRALNRALRMTNLVAVDVAASSFRERAAAVTEVTQALVHLENLYRLIIAEDPSLEYHFDPDRKPSATMRAIIKMVKKADTYTADGNIPEATKLLQQVRDMEPPPLVYEIIEKKLKALGAESSDS